MKTISALRLLLLTLLSFGFAVHARAQGTISLGNTTLSRFTWELGVSPAPVVVGVFWGTNANNLTLVLPVATITESGVMINAPSVFAIPGTDPGQTVYLQIRVWHASYGTNWAEALSSLGMYGQTDVRQVTLGQTAGPGTVIWQSSTGTNPNRFYPLVLGRQLVPSPAIALGNPFRSPVTVDEGQSGRVDAVIPVVRYPPPGVSNGLDRISSAIVCTTNMTALEGQDYVGTNVLVTFNPGEILKYVRVTILADPTPEPDEQFGVFLKSSGSYASLDQEVLIVTIREARLSSVRREADQSIVSLRTTTSQHYAVEYSTNLVNWATLAGAADIAGNGGTVDVTDAESDCCGHRFYRARVLP